MNEMIIKIDITLKLVLNQINEQIAHLETLKIQEKEDFHYCEKLSFSIKQLTILKNNISIIFK